MFSNLPYIDPARLYRPRLFMSSMEGGGVVVSLAQMIRRKRLELGMTQGELERASQVSQGYISQIERGKRIQPSEIVLANLAAALDLPLNDLRRAAGWLELREVRIAHDDAELVPVRGTVHASDYPSLTALEGSEVMHTRVLPEMIGTSYSPFAVISHDDTWISRGIDVGTIVLFESIRDDSEIRIGDLVVVRMADHYKMGLVGPDGVIYSRPDFQSVGEADDDEHDGQTLSRDNAVGRFIYKLDPLPFASREEDAENNGG